MNKYEIQNGRLYLKTEDDSMIAYILCPFVGDKAIEIKSTFVDPSIRGQGIAKEMILSLIEYVKNEGLSIVPSCSYSVKFFDEHPEYHYLILKDQ